MFEIILFFKIFVFFFHFLKTINIESCAYDMFYSSHYKVYYIWKLTHFKLNSLGGIQFSYN